MQAAVVLGASIIMASNLLGSKLCSGKSLVCFSYLLAEFLLSDKKIGKAAALEADDDSVLRLCRLSQDPWRGVVRARSQVL